MVTTKRPTGLTPSRRTMSTPLSPPNVTGPANTHACLHPLEGQTSIVIHRSGRAETCSEPRGSAYIHPHPSADDGNGTKTSKRPVIHSHSFLAIYICHLHATSSTCLSFFLSSGHQLPLVPELHSTPGPRSPHSPSQHILLPRGPHHHDGDTFSRRRPATLALMLPTRALHLPTAPVRYDLANLIATNRSVPLLTLNRT